MARFRVPKDDTADELLSFLAGRLACSRRRAKRLLDGRSVTVNGRRVWMAGHRLNAGDMVEIPEEALAAPTTIDRAIVLLDVDDYLVVNKPPGTLANGPDSLESRLRKVLRLPGLQAAHRLDRDTSGCLLFSKDEAAQQRVIELFDRRDVSKTYHAIVCARMSGRNLRITRPLDGLQAITEIRVLDHCDRASHIACNLITGRTHQIRRHMQATGHPVLGDKQYGPAPGRVPGLPHVARHMLHAASLRFRHPVSGAAVNAEAPLPDDFRACLASLGLT